MVSVLVGQSLSSTCSYRVGSPGSCNDIGSPDGGRGVSLSKSFFVIMLVVLIGWRSCHTGNPVCGIVGNPCGDLVCWCWKLVGLIMVVYISGDPQLSTVL